MARDSLLNQDWLSVVERLGGAERLQASARATRAFVPPRVILTAVDLLRLILAYRLGERGLRLTVAWASAAGLVDLSSVALLYRLRQHRANGRSSSRRPALDLLAIFRAAADGLIDQPVWLGRKAGPALALRRVAVRKPEQAAAEARRQAQKEAIKSPKQRWPLPIG